MLPFIVRKKFDYSYIGQSVRMQHNATFVPSRYVKNPGNELVRYNASVKNTRAGRKEGERKITYFPPI
jgi:hypothetical protein